MRIPDHTPYTRCGLAEDGIADLFGRLHTAGNGGMQSCEIILLHEGADLVGVHGFERVQQARGDALAADADAAQLMPDDAVRGQHAFQMCIRDRNAPDLQTVMGILGKEKVLERLSKCADAL